MTAPASAACPQRSSVADRRSEDAGNPHLPQHSPAPATTTPARTTFAEAAGNPHLPQHSPGLALAALRVAVGQIGVREVPPGTNAGPAVGRYLASVGLGPGLPWCAAFVHWCFGEAASAAGVANPVPRTGGCLDLWNRSAASPGGRRVITAAQARAVPAGIVPGLVFVHDHGGGEGHVGFVRRVGGAVFDTVEGNSNAVGSREGIGVFALGRRRIDDAMLKGFLDFTATTG